MGVHDDPVAVDDLSLLNEQPAKFDAHAPSLFVFALLAQLLRTAARWKGKGNSMR